MSRNRRRTFWSPAAIFLSCRILLTGTDCAADDAAAQPPAIIIPSRPDAPTASSEDPTVLAWTIATVYDPAVKAPAHPAKAQELAALMAIARCITHDSKATRAEAMDGIAAALAAGSKDVMIAYMNVMLSPMSRHQKALKLEELYSQWKTSPYPPSRRALCSLFILSTLTPAGDGSYDTVHEWAYQDVLAALASFPEHEQGMVRGFLAKAGEFFSDPVYLARRGATQRVLADLNAPTVPQWWSKILQGKVQISLAWMVRGNADAGHVTDLGWKGFAEHLTLADTLLTAAWNLEPERPEAASDMITVAMGDHTDNGSTFDWFNRAMAAQMDYSAAFTALYTSLLPRWLGTYDDMLRLGTAAAASGRYDTTTPWQLISAVLDISGDAREMGGDTSAALTPEVYTACAKVIAGYQARRPGSNHAYYETHLAILAWLCGRQTAESLAHLDAAGAAVESAIIQKDLHMTTAEFRALLVRSTAVAPPTAHGPAAGTPSDPVVP